MLCITNTSVSEFFKQCILSVKLIALGPSIQVHAVNCPLPLDAYLDHAWSTAGLVGAVPWMADFLRMMKWDEVSAQVVAIFTL